MEKFEQRPPVEKRKKLPDFRKTIYAAILSALISVGAISTERSAEAKPDLNKDTTSALDQESRITAADIESQELVERFKHELQETAEKYKLFGTIEVKITLGSNSTKATIELTNGEDKVILEGTTPEELLETDKPTEEKIEPAEAEVLHQTRQKIEQDKNQEKIKEYEDQKERFGIALPNPLVGVKANAELNYSIGELIGLSYEELRTNNPDLEDTFLKRAAVVGGLAALSYFNDLALHEYGHARTIEDEGVRAEVELSNSSTGFFGGRSKPKSEIFPYSVAGMVHVKTAGLNQQAYNAQNERIRTLREESDKLIHSINGLLNKFSTSAYALNKAGEANDITGYLNASQTNSRPAILVSSLLTGILSGSTIDNARQILGYLENPSKKVKKTSFQVGDAKIYLPEFSYFLTPEGGFYTAAVLTDLNDALLRVEAGAGKMGEFLEFQAYDLSLGQDVTLSPYAAISHRKKGRNSVYRAHSNQQKIGIKVGTEFAAKLTDDLAVTGDVGFAKDDMMRHYVMPEGSKSVVEGNGGTELFGWIGIKQKF